MYTYPLTLNPSSYGGAAVDKVFDLIDLDDARSVSRVAATSTTTPETLTVSHQRTLSNGIDIDRHLVRLDKTFNDDVAGKVTLSAYMVLVVPVAVDDVTSQEILDIVGRLIAFEQASGSLDKILNSEP